MEKLSKRKTILVGLTLFSMFFGAGNLIFPPYLGEQAGTHAWIAMVGFALSAVGLPVLGVVAVAKSGGIENLAKRVHPRFALIFTLLIYLSVGPCLAIPRTASTSFEMAVVPFIGHHSFVAQLSYSIVFFGIALYMAVHPEKLTDKLGKVMCPVLLCLIFIVFMGSLFVGTYQYGIPQGTYVNESMIQGFLDGYQTMDLIAALNFGIIIAMNIQNIGIKDNKSIVSYTIKAGLVAGLCLLIVYSALLHIGGISATLTGIHANGTETMVDIVKYIYQNIGVVILGAIFFIACLNTCIGLLCSCSEYFHELMPYISYKHWTYLFAGASMIVSNIGLNMILKISIPILNLLYPLSIALIALGFIHKYICRYPYIYQTTILMTGIGSVLGVLPSVGMDIHFLHMIPFFDLSLGWVLFTVVGFFMGLLMKDKT